MTLIVLFGSPAVGKGLLDKRPARAAVRSGDLPSRRGMGRAFADDQLGRNEQLARPARACSPKHVENGRDQQGIGMRNG